MIKKLRRKFVLIIMIIVTIMLSAMAGMTYLSTKSNLENENLRMMKTAAQRPVSDEDVSPDTPPDNKQKRTELQPFFVIHLSEDGEKEIFGSSYYDLTDEDFITEIVSEASSSDTDTGTISSYSLCYYRQHFPDGENIVFSDTSAQTAALHHMAKNLLMISGLSFFIFLLLSILLSHWAVHPAEQAWNQQKQFISDASHELKTPLTVIMTNAELALENDYSASEHHHFISNIQVESEHMHHLVEQMLELARADHAADTRSLTVFNGSDAVNASVMTMEAAIFEMGHPIETSVEDNIDLKGDANQIRQLVEILLDNAGKYADADSTIRLVFKKQGKNHCLLTVANEGAPIPEDVLKNLFKRFYRADEARSRNGSFGLGLAIAERIVSGLNGRIRAESRDGWNIFSIVLPVFIRVSD